MFFILDHFLPFLQVYILFPPLQALNEKQLECEHARTIVSRTEMEMEHLEAEVARTKQERKEESSTTVVRTTTLEVRIHQLEAEVERWKQEADRIMS